MENTEIKLRSVELSRNCIVGYFHYLAKIGSISGDGLAEMLMIKSDDKLLLEHIKAWINIFTDAKEYLEENIKNEK